MLLPRQINDTDHSHNIHYREPSHLILNSNKWLAEPLASSETHFRALPLCVYAH
jgi:hypothetical protein